MTALGLSACSGHEALSLDYSLYMSTEQRDSDVFARSATLRHLTKELTQTTKRSQTSSQERPGLQTRRNVAAVDQLSCEFQQVKAFKSSSVRPSTAAVTRSRIHQSLRHSESEFVLSAKLQSPTAPIEEAKSPVPAIEPLQLPSRPNQLSDRRPSSSHHCRGPIRGIKTPVQIIHPKTRTLIKPIATAEAQQRKTSVLNASQQLPEDPPHIQRKRRCAKTFELMIYARLHPNKSNQGSDSSGPSQESVQALLGHGIVQSLLTLSTIADAITQAHCCRALYYLAQMPCARKAMVAHGVVASVKVLARVAHPRSRQDLAATLCYLSEENGLVEVLFFEGIDRALTRLFVSPSQETKRCCALAVLNISCDATRIKHFGDSFTQLLATCTRTAGPSSSCHLIKAVYNASLIPSFQTALLSENIPGFLVNQLVNVPPDVQLLALQALIALCDIKTNRSQILSQQFCKLLATMLASIHAEIQELTLLVLLLLSIDEGARTKLCNWVPAATIVRTAQQHVDAATSASTSSSDDCQHSTQSERLVYLHSCVFRSLCDSVLTHHDLVQEGAVRVLIQMARKSDNDIKTNAICALCCIIASFTDETTSKHVPEITDELLKLTETRQTANCLFAVSALYNIACSDECRPLLIESETLIVRLLELAQQPQHAQVAQLLAAIIYRLACIDGRQKTLLDQGCFCVLVHLIHQYPQCRTFAVSALFILAQGGGDSFPHGGEEIAQLTLAMSKKTTASVALKRAISQTSSPAAASPSFWPSPDAAKNDKANAMRGTVALFAYLASDPKNQRLLLTDGAVFRFLKSVKQLESDDEDEEDTIVINCAFVFYTLTATQEGCEQLIKEGGMADLIHLSRVAKLSVESNHMVRELCIMALCRVSSFPGLEVRLIEHGAIEAIMILALVTTDSPSIKALCVKTLANCLVAKNCVRPLVEHGIIWALSSLCTVDFADTRFACAVSLCNLSSVSTMVSRFLDAGAPRALIHLLQHRDDPGTVMVTIKTIANLVANEKICAAFLNEDLERHLGVHFSSAQSSDELRQLAAMVLLRVTSANDAMISLEHLKSGVFLWMEQIIVIKEQALVRNCILTVRDLTGNSSIDIAELDVAHILRIVIQVFHRHADNGEIVTLCLSILYNLSCQPAVLFRLVRADIMLFLREHVPREKQEDDEGDGNARPKRASNASSIVSTVAAVMDVKLCCLILHNLTCAPGNASNLLASLVNLHVVAILRDIYSQRDELKEICAVATGNIAVARVNTTRVVADRACEILLPFIRSSLFQKQHHALMSAALLRLATAPGNQRAMLKAGVVSAFVHMLSLREIDSDASANVLATVSLLSKYEDHVKKLLEDGMLPCVVMIAEGRDGQPPPPCSSEIQGYCFEILSSMCTGEYEQHLQQHPEMNVINTLTKLSEHHHHNHNAPSAPGSPAAGARQAPQWQPPKTYAYYERGEGRPLPSAQVLTFLMKIPTSSSLKKNLELQTTYVVPAKKWLPEVKPNPKEPPPLECNEVALTESNASVPSDVKQRIRDFVPAPKETLVCDDSLIDETLFLAPASGSGVTSVTGIDPVPAAEADDSSWNSPKLVQIKKKLLRSGAGRDLSSHSPSFMSYSEM